MKRRARIGGLALLLLLVSGPGDAQTRDGLQLTSSLGQVEAVLYRHYGFPAVGVEVLRTAGWSTVPVASGATVATLRGARLEIRPDVPFVKLDSSWLQLVEAPYQRGDSLFLPIQLLVDLLPDRFPDLYATDGAREVRVLDASVWGAGSRSAAAAESPVREDDGVRVVIIDPGHGGVDPGALGGRRTREKDVTLAIGKALAEALSGDPDLKVYLTREDDQLVPLWERGEIATRLKGDRYGIFVSIHANSVTQRGVRGVETYFLSEARTEHEARVAALENSAMELERNHRSGPDQGELGDIISELLNLDFQRWSSELAGAIQNEVTGVHPGPDRGVKQAPLAVLTNAMMPSVLLEAGFITNPSEEDLLADAGFHRDFAGAVARAIRDFFERYPPGA